MDGFSVTSLTSLCTSIANRAASSAAELDALVKSSPPDSTSDLLCTVQDFLAKLNLEASQLERALDGATCISQSLQGALHKMLAMGDEAFGKLHKQLMRLQPQNVHAVDTNYVLKFVPLLMTHVQVLQLFTEAAAL